MEKKVIVGSVVLAVLLFLISGCDSADYAGDLPSEPTPPVSKPTGAPSGDLAGRASYVFEQGFSSPFDVYEEDVAKAQLFFLTKNDIDLLGFQEDTFTFPVRVEHTGGVVYKYGYVYTIPRGWERYEFTEQTYRGSNWIVTKAEKTLTLNRADFQEGTNWIVAYSCKKQAGKWRCGMQQKDGTGGVWMLQSFAVRNLGTPAEPSAPENACTDTIDGGKNYGTRGTASGVIGSATETDECVDANKLKEWYCGVSATNQPIRLAEEYVCPNGCANGACLAQVAVATGTVVCEVPLVDYGVNPAAETTFTSTITSATARSNCEAYQIFGTEAKDAFAVDATKLTGEVFTKPNPYNTAEQHEWLRCTLSCVPQYDQATKCKDISDTSKGLTDTTINSAESKAQLYIVAKKSATACS